MQLSQQQIQGMMDNRLTPQQLKERQERELEELMPRLTNSQRDKVNGYTPDIQRRLVYAKKLADQNAKLFRDTFGEGVSLGYQQNITGVEPVHLKLNQPRGLFKKGSTREIQMVPHTLEDYLQALQHFIINNRPLPTPEEASFLIYNLQQSIEATLNDKKIPDNERRINLERIRDYVGKYTKYAPIWTTQGIGIGPEGITNGKGESIGLEYVGKPITGLVGAVNMQVLEELIDSSRLPDSPLVEPDYDNIVEVNPKLIGQKPGHIQRYEVIGQGKVGEHAINIVFPITGDKDMGLGRTDTSSFFSDKNRSVVPFVPLVVAVQTEAGRYIPIPLLTTSLPYISHAAWEVLQS